jgi:DNA-directed RNA polymerase subunit H (RpoH/RPB5)
MNYETIDVLYKSRLTLLKILAGRGYNTTPYEKFGPIEISAMVAAGDDALRMDLERPAEGTTRLTKCTAIYSLARVKTRMNSFIQQATGEESGFDPTTTEMIVICLEPIVEAFHTAALSSLAKKIHLSFFSAHTLVNNPLEHILVPKHELLPSSEHKTFLAANKIKSKENLPIIRFHEDMIARIMGLVPGDIVKITRPSPSAGTYESYRVCSF